MVGSEGPRWETVNSFTATFNHSLWIATGSNMSGSSLVLRGADGAYAVGLFNGSTHFIGDLVKEDSPEAALREQCVYATGVLNVGQDRNVVVGASGLYRIEGQSISTIVRFSNTKQEIPEGADTLEWEWIPTHIVSLKGGDFVVGGQFGGTYLLSRTTTGQFRLISLDEKLGPSLQF